MATLAALAEDVYTLTNRPDLVAETILSLKKALRKYHGADTWKRDINITRIDMTALTPVAPNQYRWNIPLDTFTRYRRMKGVNYPTDLSIPSPPVPAPLVDYTIGFNVDRVFHEIAPDNLFDRYGYERQNYFFITGNTLLVKSGWYVDFLDYTYYMWPAIPASSGEVFEDWIISSYPDSIVEEAAGQVFKMIGKDDESNRFMQMFADNLAIIKSTDIGEVA